MERGVSTLVGGVAPVVDGGAEVVYGTFGDSVGDLGHEGELFVLAGVELFVEVLPGWPGQPVGAAEAMSGDAEVVDET